MPLLPPGYGNKEVTMNESDSYPLIQGLQKQKGIRLIDKLRRMGDN